MSCITQLMALKGDKEFLPVHDHLVIEGDGVYKDHEYLIVFTSAGHRCGHVALTPEEHLKAIANRDPKNTFFLPDDISWHGGVTFYDNGHAAKHLLPTPCDDFWLGFDAAHCNDLPDPELALKYFNDHDEAKHRAEWITEIGHYKDVEHRTFEYMENECFGIIDQLDSWNLNKVPA
jgi:hypothetical protein